MLKVVNVRHIKEPHLSTSYTENGFVPRVGDEIRVAIAGYGILAARIVDREFGQIDFGRLGQVFAILDAEIEV